MSLEDKWKQEGKKIAPVAKACIEENGEVQRQNLISPYCSLANEDLNCPYRNNYFVIHAFGRTFPHCLYEKVEK